MNEKISGEIKALAERIMGYEARKILIKKGLHNPVSSPDPRQYKGDTEVKKRLLELIQTEEDLELFKSASLEYLTFQIQIATKNPSFRILKKQIINGEYDFIKALGLENYTCHAR